MFTLSARGKPLVIRRMRVGDVYQVIGLGKRYFRDEARVFGLNTGWKFRKMALAIVTDKFLRVTGRECYPAFVVSDSSHVVGYVTGVLGKSPYGSKALYVDEVCVDQRYRRMRLGERLIQALFNVARAHKCAYSYLYVRSKNIPALRFYLAMGFQQRNEDCVYFLEKTHNKSAMRLNVQSQYKLSAMEGPKQHVWQSKRLIELVPTRNLLLRASYERVFKSFGMKRGAIVLTENTTALGLCEYKFFTRGVAAELGFPMISTKGGRDEGIAEFMILAGVSFLKKLGAYNVYIRVDANDNQAKSILEGLGFREVFKWMLMTKDF